MIGEVAGEGVGLDACACHRVGFAFGIGMGDIISVRGVVGVGRVVCVGGETEVIVEVEIETGVGGVIVVGVGVVVGAVIGVEGVVLELLVALSGEGAPLP